MSVFFCNTTPKKTYFCRFKKSDNGEGFILLWLKNQRQENFGRYSAKPFLYYL